MTPRNPRVTPDTVFRASSFGQVHVRACPKDGGTLVYQYGNWHCGGYYSSRCKWTTAVDGPQGTVTLEKCPACGSSIVYSGNYFCERWGDGCDWALPHPATRKGDREMAVRLTGEAS